MNKHSLSFQTLQLRNRREEIKNRIGEIAEALKQEQRARNEAENKEYAELCRELDTIEMEIRALSLSQPEALRAQSLAEADRIVRENMSAGKPTTVEVFRDVMMVTDAQKGGIVALNIQDILRPLQAGLIFDKVGLEMKTGLSGEYVWPVYEAIEAQIAGEDVTLTDQKITLSQLKANPDRIGTTIAVTRQSIVQSNGIVEAIVKEAIPAAITLTLNKAMFSPTKVGTAVNLVGPFVALKDAPTKTLTAATTLRDLVMLKAKVLASGVNSDSMCWVMTEAQKAILETTPVDAGSGRMVCEADKIAGYPVFCTPYITEDFIGLGAWRYEPCGQFGDFSFIIDPFTGATRDEVRFTLNTMFGFKTLRPEAFALLKVKNS